MATVRDLVRAAVRAAEEKKATDVKAIDIRGLSAVTDYMIIATGSSDTNVRAIAEGIREDLIKKGDRPFSVEGLREGSWVLLDYVDFVVHVFHREKRSYFGLEELWADAKPMPVTDLAARKPADRGGLKPAAKPAARAAGKEPLPQVPRTAPKPAGKGSAVPKKAVAKKTAPKKTTAKQAVPARKRGASKSAVAPKKAPRAAAAPSVPKPKKAVVPKRKV